MRDPGKDPPPLIFTAGSAWLVFGASGVLADLDPPKFGPPGPNSLADLDPRGNQSASGFGPASCFCNRKTITETLQSCFPTN